MTTLVDEVRDYAAEELLTRLPDFLRRVADADSVDDAAIDEALAAAGLVDASPPDDRPRRRSRWVRLEVRPDEERKPLERKLRAAISRAVGKTSGRDKRWDVGGRSVSMTCLDAVELELAPQLSLSALRRAAAAWLAGEDVRSWLVEHRFVAPETEPGDDGAWPRHDDDPARSIVRSGDDGQVRVSFFMEAGVRPPGSTAEDDDERFEQTLAFLDEGLGASWPMGWWHAGSRSFSIRRQRSSARSITFIQAPQGRVDGPGLVGLVTIDATPEPEPGDAVARIRELVAVRGLPLEDAQARLVAAGVVTSSAPRQLPGTVALSDPQGRDLEFALVDGRVSQSIVQVAADSRDLHDRVDAVFTEAFGAPQDRWRWSLGAQTITCSRSGAPGFERLRAHLGEVAVDQVDAARGWLLAAEPLGDMHMHDNWHARCVAAEISAQVVPAAGRPATWQVDDRLLWIEGGRLIGAEGSHRPSWASELTSPGASHPLPAAEVATFARWLAESPEPTPGAFDAAVVDLGWATDDPDARTTRAGDTTVRLRHPAGGVMKTLVRDDGTVKSWTLTVSHAVGADAASTAAAEVESVLAPYRDGARTRGWQIGSSRVEAKLTHHDPGLYLTGTVAAGEG